MTAPGDTSDLDATASPSDAPDLPQQVRRWLEPLIGPDETVRACLFADILPSGCFGEQWSFVTTGRLLVIGADGGGDRAHVALEIALDAIESARVESYVGAGALVVMTGERAHEVARFSLGSHHEALNLCHFINDIVKGRAEGLTPAEVAVPVTRRPEHRCPRCGRAKSRMGQVCTHCIDHRRILLRLLSYVLPYGRAALGGLAMTIVITFMQLAPPYLTKVLIDSVLIPGSVNLLPAIVGALIGVNLVAAIVSVFRTYVMQWVGQKVLFDMRVRLFNHLQLLRLSFYSQQQTGRIMSRVSGDLSRLQYFVAEGFQELIVNVATMALIAVILVFMNGKLFLLALAPTPVIAVCTWLFGKRVHMLYHRIWRRMAGLNAILADTIPGIRVVKAFAQERRESRRFETRSHDLFGNEMMAAKLASVFFPFIHLQTALGTVLIFSVGGYMVIHGMETVGTLVAFTGYLWRFYVPVQQFGRMNHRLQHCMTSAERVFEVLDTEPEPLHSGGTRLEPIRGKVEFRNVRFSYEPGKYALDGVSFTVEPGEMIGLVGPSGAGKSTLVHLIARFYDIDEGEILIDDCRIDELDLELYRRQIGVVLQEPYLFHGSIWSNIAYANPEAAADEIIAAARAANAHDFIVNLSDGYDTVIGERGQTLSGGERQRISIARAVLCNPRILILDEATASVDTETEAMIQSALERLVLNRTTFAIAHRLSTLRKAHRLVVLEQSKLVEVGTHDELIASDGLYAHLCRLQSDLSKIKAW